MANLLQAIRAAVQTPPLLVGDVVSVSGADVRLQLPDGSLASARGDTTIGATVYFRPGGAIEGQAPALGFVEIEV